MVGGEGTIGAGNGSALRAEKVIIGGHVKAKVDLAPSHVDTVAKKAGVKAGTAQAGNHQTPAQRSEVPPAEVVQVATPEEQRAAAEKATLEAVEKARVDAEKLVAEVEAKKAAQMVEEAVALLGGKEGDARTILKLLSGGEATLVALKGQMNAEIKVLKGEKLSPQAMQEKFDKIQKKYQKLSEYVANRQVDTRNMIEKMKRSKNPEHQALGLDLEIAMIQANAISYQKTIDDSQAILDKNIGQNGKPLEELERKERETIIKALTDEKAELTKKIEGEPEKYGLRAQREKIRDKEGNVIPDVVKQTAIALTGGDVDAAKIANENPVGYIEGIMANALTDEVAMNQLVANLNRPEVGLIKDDKDKAEFMKFMKLGLTTEEKIKMIKKEGGNTLISLVGVMGLLGYVAWKKTLEGGGQPMMG